MVETSSLSAVQPPEPTYDLTIMDELDETKVLSCLQIETIVYASQVSYLLAVDTSLFLNLCMYCICCKSRFLYAEAPLSSAYWC